MKIMMATAFFLVAQAGFGQEMSCCGQLPSRFAPVVPESRVWIPAGEFMMGGVGPYAKPDEFPSHRVRLDGFWISRTPITNDQFSEFVQATGYSTTAERAPTAEEILAQSPPGALPPPAEFLIAASLVFKP